MAFGELIWSSLAGSFFQVLFDQLISSGLKFVQREGIDAQPYNWKEMLQDIYQQLNDVENRQLFGDPKVEAWLDDVRDLAYNLEDLLDELAIEAAKQEPGPKSSTSGSLRKRKWLFSPFLVPDANMRSKMQDIDSRLQDVLTRKDHLSLKDSAMGKSISNQDVKRSPSTSLKEPCFVGRKEDENAMIQLLRTNVNHPIPTVIPIIGMGGVQKTTLAQRVYNHPQVTSHFEVKAWACVSDVFDVPSITRAILQLIGPMPCEGKDLHGLQVNLEENLSRKKFLLVLDNIRNEEYEEWIAFLKPFQSRVDGSKVVVTTCNLKVASITGAHAYHMKELQRDDCMALFTYHALRSMSLMTTHISK